MTKQRSHAKLPLLLATAAVSADAKATRSNASFLMLLGDDIGWGDMHYNNGTALTPNIDKWTKTPGTVTLMDFHSGGTVCSPTRATVLTGRNHFRDCVNYVFECSDMTQCVPKFKFAPERTFTIADAFQLAHPELPSTSQSFFTGKWHLGSLYKDSAKYDGIWSSPASHGFSKFNVTLEVSPTATTNCQCRSDWYGQCNFGHYANSTQIASGTASTGLCVGHSTPGEPSGDEACCFNYWWNDDSNEHGVTNLSNPSPDDDSEYVTSAFDIFLNERQGNPFVAHISFHNCHIPYIGTVEARDKCRKGETCRLPDPGAKPYTEWELDFYACLNELDGGVGRVLETLGDRGYYDDTMVWFTTDNGPEINCPNGICGGTFQRPEGPWVWRPKKGLVGPGSQGLLRGRKRDTWEGGHRVPGIVSYPRVVGKTYRTSWETVVTMDFLATMMDVLGLNVTADRPEAQRNWAFDGKSIMPILKDEAWPVRGIGWMFWNHNISKAHGIGFRYGPWKLVNTSLSCRVDNSTGVDMCATQLYNLDDDLGERHDLSKSNPTMVEEMSARFDEWYQSIQHSWNDESHCGYVPDEEEMMMRD